jgi:hypothetical protein
MYEPASLRERKAAAVENEAVEGDMVARRCG